ncbi:hypothetical protein [Desulfogranum mediterraneum]|uniref:hypothetical protein n=1 Tax=Desulfogranum mediterraneum TaxID=160661 RepID=UPI00048C3F54|nr:hypothetical protein [Desulfogranum mediterraneum]
MSFNKTIIQEETTGCGIASVANVVGKSYSEVKNLANSVGIFAEDQSLFSDTNYVRKLLQEYDISVSGDEKPFVSWDELPDMALLAIKYQEVKGRPFWHWVVFQRSNGMAVVKDSASYLENNHRVDFSNMKPKWFIEVLQPDSL